MPHTNPWSDTIPTDPSQANALGADIRQARLDIEERMNDILKAGGQMTDDPCVVDDAKIGPTVGLKHYIPFTSFVHGTTTAVETIYYDSGIDVARLPGAVSQHYLATVRLPVGAVITQVEALAQISNGNTATIQLKKALMSGGGAWSVVATSSCLGTGAFVHYTDATFNHTTADALYILDISTPNTNDYWTGIVITYTRPNLATGQ